ncbi:MAG: hypothetical protein IPM70_18310 [Proteobacteria bacterium]|nr:hypothetical protein [Pseudomonadota bacterium]
MDVSDKKHLAVSGTIRLILTRLLVAPVVIAHMPLIPFIKERIGDQFAFGLLVIGILVLFPLLGALEVIGRNQPTANAPLRLLLGRISASTLLLLIPLSVWACSQSKDYPLTPLQVTSSVAAVGILVYFFRLAATYEKHYLSVA